MSWPKGLVVEAGGPGVVSHAGSAATRLLADRTGLTGGLSGALARRGFTPLHDRGRVLADLAVAIADGATTISEIDALRHQEELFGPVASDSTAWRTLAGCGPAALARIGRARARARSHVWGLIAARHGGIPPARAAGRDLGEVIVIRLDATIVIAHSDKEQAKGTFKGSYGHHPLTAWCDNTGESLAVLLRPGNAGSNTAADHIAVTGAAIAQIPARHRRQMLITCDGAGSTHALVDHVTALNTRPGYQVHYSVGLDFDERIRSVLPDLPETAWNAALEADGTPRPDAQVAELTGLLRHSAARRPLRQMARGHADPDPPREPAPRRPADPVRAARGQAVPGHRHQHPRAARSSSSKHATGPRPASRPASAAARPPACGTCPRGTTRSTPPGARPPPSPATCSPGSASSPSTATSPQPSRKRCATRSSTPPDGSSKASATATCGYQPHGPGPATSPRHSPGSWPCPRHEPATPPQPPGKETTSRPWNRRPPDATAGQAPPRPAPKNQDPNSSRRVIRPARHTREELRLVVWTGTQANGANVQQVVLLVPSGTPVVDSDLAGDVTIAADSRASWVIGNISPGKSRWIGVPDGTSNNLRMFGPDGRLYYTQVSGMGSPARPAGRKCWAARKGQVVIPFFTSPRPAAQCCGSATSGTRITRWRSP